MLANSNPNAADSNAKPFLLPEIGPDGLPREAPVIAYTEKIILEEQLQIQKYIEENYSKIREVERDLANLRMEMQLTSGPKKAALEHMRKKIEMSTERIWVAKLKEVQARQAWEVAEKAVKDEDAIKQKLCEDLNKLVQESSNAQFARLEELKRRLEALNPNRSYASAPSDGSPMGVIPTGGNKDAPLVPSAPEPVGGSPERVSDQISANAPVMNGLNQQPSADGEGRGKKTTLIHGRGNGIGAVPKGRGYVGPGWTGAGFDVDGKT